MNIKDIKVGQILMITGKNSGCNGVEKCFNCEFYKDHKIRVIKIKQGIKMCVVGEKLDKTSHCCFDPRDLSPLTWKDRFEIK